MLWIRLERKAARGPAAPWTRYPLFPYHSTSSMSSIQRNACLSCRQRKLKCDRQFPCANCVARSVECEQQQLPPASRGVKRSFEETSSTTISSILCRLDQIEAYIDATRKDANACHVSTPIGLQTNTVRPHVPDPLPATPALPQDRGTRSNSIGYGVQLVEFSAHDNILVCSFCQ